MIKIIPHESKNIMHIAFIEDTKLHGGTQLWVMDAVEFFLSQGWEITVITPTNGWIANECYKISKTINLVTYDYLGIITQSKKFVRIWGESLANSDIALCTVHPPRKNFHCSIFAAKCIKELDLQVTLVTKTGTIVPSYKRQYYLPNQLINKRIITITKTIYHHLMSEYKIPEDKIKLLYQGIDLRYFRIIREAIKSSLKDQFSLYKPIIGCVGSLEQRKGQIYLLKAIDIIRRDRIPNIHLLIIGDGPDEERLKEKVNELNLQALVTFVPFTRNILEYFLVCDILALPSISKEGLPNVILEAFSMKIPVVASDIGGISEVVKNRYTGSLVEPGNVDDLVNAILSLWQDQKCYVEMGMNAKQFVMDHHDRKSQMFKFEEYFRTFF
ncbi:MAG: glycosyltransferase family 4 protein [Candidatus Kariarchaeaceae archaeon]|jgi:glycosyltransferase involved in cell wall biosynthesis